MEPIALTKGLTEYMDLTLSHINKDYVSRKHLFSKKHITHALKDISIRFEAGNIYALVGKNGAGKTTLLKIIAGIVAQDSGSVRIGAAAVLPHQVAYVSSNEKIFFEYLTVEQNVRFFSEISGLASEEIRTKLDVYSRMFFLHGHLSKKCWQLSSGMKRKIAIILGLMRDARILLIDEIFDKIDKHSRQALMKHLREIADKEKKVVIYTSHLTEYVPELYDRIVEVEGGVLVHAV